MSNPIPVWSPANNVVSLSDKKLELWKGKTVNYVMGKEAENPLQAKLFSYLGDLVCLIEDAALNSIFYSLSTMKGEVVQSIIQAKNQQDFELIKLLSEGITILDQLPKPDWCMQLEIDEFGREGN